MRRILPFLLLLAWLAGGCGKGELIPLAPPGAGGEWPADGGWLPVGGLFGASAPLDAVADTTTGTVVIVGREGTVFEHGAAGWSRVPLGLKSTLRSVISLGDDEFLAVGDGGSIIHRVAGQWREEEAGTRLGLSLVLSGAGQLWAVGQQGTVLRRDETGWQQLPPPNHNNLAGAAVVHDSLFVVSDASVGGVEVWDGDHWGTLGGGPWGEARVAGVATVFGEHLYVAADSLYGRGPAGWQVITDQEFSDSSSDVLRTKVVGGTLWCWFPYRWFTVTPAGAEWRPGDDWRSGTRVTAPLGGGELVTVSSSYEIIWHRPDDMLVDPTGGLRVYASYVLSGETILLNTRSGLVTHNGTGLVTILSAAARDSILGDSIRAVCGRGVADFYVATRTTLFHHQADQWLMMGTSSAVGYGQTMALASDQQLHMADSRGLWQWSGTSWVQETPVPTEVERRYVLWRTGDGQLLARDNDAFYYRWQSGQWLPLGHLDGPSVVTTAADGTFVAIGNMNESLDFTGGNTLQVYNESAGAFRNLWAAGMGPLRYLSLGGGLRHEDELLVWAGERSMVFRLKGDPRQADWEVVAGPLDAKIKQLAVLPDGALLVLDDSRDRFHLYRR